MTLGLWESIKELGKGGQGTVYLVKKRNERFLNPQLLDQIVAWISSLPTVGRIDKQQAAANLIDYLREFVLDCFPENFALKVLHEFENDEAKTKALGRLKQEVATAETVRHPSLIRIHEAHPDEMWFVMDYYPETLTKKIERTRGDLLASLIAFRPLAEAVSILHRNNIIHRDIKPDNIFVAPDGRLVLGDFGLAIQTGNSGRLSDKYENVGSRDWMPGWAMGMKLEDVNPTFDVFSLGKVLWSMLSGKSILRLWYLHDPEFELEDMFRDRSMRWARELLDKCVVEREKDCLRSADLLLLEVDRYIGVLKSSGQLPRHGPLECCVCRLGQYTENIREDVDQKVLACNCCGNTQTFYRANNRKVWQQAG